VRHHTGPDGRLSGVGTNFDNANDFAFLMALTFPFCFAFNTVIPQSLRQSCVGSGYGHHGVALVLTASRVGLVTVVVEVVSVFGSLVLRDAGRSS